VFALPVSSVGTASGGNCSLFAAWHYQGKARFPLHSPSPREASSRQGGRHNRSSLEPAAARSFTYPAFQGGREARQEAAGCVCPLAEPQMPQAASDALAWLRRACCRAGPREALIRVAPSRWSPFGRSHGRCYCEPLRCLLLSLRADAMKRRSRAGGKPAKARPRKALKRKGGSAPKAVSVGRSSLGQTEVARLTRDRDDTLAQQVATADVLQTISSSPGNLDTVLETILANATRLCEANFGVLLLYEGAHFRLGNRFGFKLSRVGPPARKKAASAREADGKGCIGTHLHSRRAQIPTVPVIRAIHSVIPMGTLRRGRTGPSTAIRGCGRASACLGHQQNSWR
jgi:hypothetical protein